MRAMTSRGLILETPAAARLDLPERRIGLESVARELEFVEPILRGGRPLAPLFSKERGLEALSLSHRTKDYLFVLNRGREPAPWPSVLGGRGWRALFETRRDPLDLLDKDGSRRFLPPAKVLVLEKKRGL